MTAPNPARDAQPGQRFTDPDDGTWVRRVRTFVTYPWAHYDANGVFAGRTQEEAEAAGLVLLVSETAGPTGALVAGWCVIHYPDAEVEQAVAEELDASLDLADEERESATAAVVKRLREFEPAPLDPGNPEHLRQVAEFVEEHARRGGALSKPGVEYVNADSLRRDADCLDREHAEAEQAAADLELIEDARLVQLKCGGDEFDFGMALLRAERARAEETKP